MKQVQNGVTTEVKSLPEMAAEGVSYVLAAALLTGVTVAGHKLRMKMAKKVFRAIFK